MEGIKSTTECVAPILPPTLNKRQITLKEYALLMGANIINKLCPLNNLVSHEGNKKIPSSTCIFNFSPVFSCPSRKLGLCAAEKAGVKCYSQKSEYDYRPFVKPYRQRQEKFWQSVTAEEFVVQFLLMNSMKRNPFTKIRFSESGDFHNQSEVDKIEKISKALARFGIKVYGYTSRSDLDYSKVKYAIISGSNFVKKGISNRFRIVKNIKIERLKGESICKGNCRKCNMCSIRGKKIIALAH